MYSKKWKDVNVEKYYIDERKLIEYALNPEKQLNKARAFEESLGYNLSNYKELIENIYNNIKPNEFLFKNKNDYGILYEQIINILGVNGKRANVLTAWIEKEESFKLTSIYVTKKKRRNE